MQGARPAAFVAQTSDCILRKTRAFRPFGSLKSPFMWFGGRSPRRVGVEADAPQMISATFCNFSPLSKSPRWPHDDAPEIQPVCGEQPCRPTAAAERGTTIAPLGSSVGV